MWKRGEERRRSPASLFLASTICTASCNTSRSHFDQQSRLKGRDFEVVLEELKAWREKKRGVRSMLS